MIARNFSHKLLFLSLTFLPLGTSCATSRSIASLEPSQLGDEIQAQSPLLAIQTRLIAEEGSSEELGCTLHLTQVNPVRARFHLNLEPGEQTFFLLLPEGKYEGGELACATKTWKFAHPVFEGAVLTPGKTSYAGKFIFKFEDGGLAMGISDRKETLNSLSSLLKDLPSQKRGSLISAYTQKPITSEMLGLRSHYDFKILIRQSSGTDVDTESVFAQLQACAESVSSEDPLLIGHINWSALYRNGKYVDLERSRNAHAFSNTYVDCIEKSLRGFQPRTLSRVELLLTF